MAVRKPPLAAGWWRSGEGAGAGAAQDTEERRGGVRQLRAPSRWPREVQPQAGAQAGAVSFLFQCSRCPGTEMKRRRVGICALFVSRGGGDGVWGWGGGGTSHSSEGAPSQRYMALMIGG